MLFPLIPFFLVARMEIDDSGWTDGPELVFDVRLDRRVSPKYDGGAMLSNHTTGHLLCRPNSSDCLTCRLNNLERECHDLTNESMVTSSKSEIEGIFTEEPFEVKFNQRGIEHLIVDGETLAVKLNNIRNVVHLLNIGADLNGIPDGNFNTVENSTVGECNVTFEVRHEPFRGLPRELKNKRYYLESLPQLNKVPGETIKVDKERNLSNCTWNASAYYWSYDDDTESAEKGGTRLVRSKSTIEVSDTLFHAWTSNEGYKGSYVSGNNSFVLEMVTLELKNIRAANGTWPAVARPAKTSIVTNSDVDPIILNKTQLWQRPRPSSALDSDKSKNLTLPL